MSLAGASDPPERLISPPSIYLMPGSTSPEPHGSFFGRFWPIFLLGLVGILSLPLIVVPMLRAGELPEGMPDLPFWALVVLTLVNPLLLLAAAAALGAWLAPKVGLTSLVAARVSEGRTVGPALRGAAPLAIGFGLGLAAMTLLLDLAFQHPLPPNGGQRRGRWGRGRESARSSPASSTAGSPRR